MMSGSDRQSLVCGGITEQPNLPLEFLHGKSPAAEMVTFTHVCPFFLDTQLNYISICHCSQMWLWGWVLAQGEQQRLGCPSQAWPLDPQPLSPLCAGGAHYAEAHGGDEGGWSLNPWRTSVSADPKHLP